MGLIQQTLITKSGLGNTLPLSYCKCSSYEFIIIFKIFFHKADNLHFYVKTTADWHLIRPKSEENISALKKI